MNERIKFCLEWQQRWDEAEGDRVDIAELCRVFDVSRQRGYVWLRRFREAGFDVRVLEDRSRRPHRNPTAISERMQDMVVRAYSRFCIRCELVEEPDALAVEHILDSAFRAGWPAGAEDVSINGVKEVPESRSVAST